MGKILLITLTIFLLEVMLYNVIKPNLPRIPGDLWINKFGFQIYIPFVSTLVLTVIATFLLGTIK